MWCAFCRATSTTTRTVTWQVNNGAPGTPSGTNEKTTTVNVSDGPTPGALTFVTDSGTTDLNAGHTVTFTLAPVDAKAKERYRDPPDAQSRLVRGFAQERCGGKVEFRDEDGKRVLLVTLKAKI